MQVIRDRELSDKIRRALNAFLARPLMLHLTKESCAPGEMRSVLEEAEKEFVGYVKGLIRDEVETQLRERHGNGSPARA
jgi:hypothetical protein